MPLFDNESRILQIEKEKAEIFQYMKSRIILIPNIQMQKMLTMLSRIC